jgi:hypothetical protein
LTARVDEPTEVIDVPDVPAWRLKGDWFDGEVSAFGFDWDWAGRSSKHMAFEWSGPD